MIETATRLLEDLRLGKAIGEPDSSEIFLTVLVNSNASQALQKPQVLLPRSRTTSQSDTKSSSGVVTRLNRSKGRVPTCAITLSGFGQRCLLSSISAQGRTEGRNTTRNIYINALGVHDFLTLLSSLFPLHYSRC
jgi:hypothetical protein